jgi:hypothetical protein
MLSKRKPVEVKAESKSLASLLTKKPKKDDYENTPHRDVRKSGAFGEADILFLPNDRGYKYALVYTDVGNGATDAVPLKQKTAAATTKGFQKMFARNIVKFPTARFTLDAGTEFKGETKQYIEKQKTPVLYALAGRHRQLAQVENRNGLIGKALLTKQLEREIETGKQNKQWIDELPLVVNDINKRLKHEPEPIETMDDIGELQGNAPLLNEGDKVRRMLDEPRDYLTNKRLPNGFRSADIRFEPKVRTIEHVLLQPDKPPMYKLEGLYGTVYTRNQLQLVK